ncbi:MAG: hypothetical protein AAFY65_10815 [Pseudomonadota bacterium]
MTEAAWVLDRRGWYVQRSAEVFAVARRVPVRWDVVAETTLPDMGRRRLAHAIRQDMWRMLQKVRGFTPAVAVARRDGHVHVRAGGQVPGGAAGPLAARVADMLDDPRHRAAWARAARHRGTS